MVDQSSSSEGEGSFCRSRVGHRRHLLLDERSSRGFPDGERGEEPLLVADTLAEQRRHLVLQRRVAQHCSIPRLLRRARAPVQSHHLILEVNPDVPQRQLSSLVRESSLRMRDPLDIHHGILNDLARKVKVSHRTMEEHLSLEVVPRFLPERRLLHQRSRRRRRVRPVLGTVLRRLALLARCLGGSVAGVVLLRFSSGSCEGEGLSEVADGGGEVRLEAMDDTPRSVVL
jgi:DNA-binding transcriptional ArsR family regulator